MNQTSSSSAAVAKAAAKSEAKSNVCAKLWDAMKGARASQNITAKSRAPMLAYLQDVATMTKYELQGLTTHCIEREHPDLNPISQRVILALMKAPSRSTWQFRY